jgi:hypothetical protein
VRRLSALLVACAILGTTPGLTHAGTCDDQIVKLRQATQLGHQPMPGLAWRGQTYAQLMFSADLTRAEALDAEGNEQGCLSAARRARHRLRK